MYVHNNESLSQVYMYAKGIAMTYGLYMRVSIVMVVDRGRLPYESYVSM